MIAMKDIENSCKIALVQAEPVMFDKSASLKKALQQIAEAAAQKPDLIVFPELFIPGYPVGMNFGFCIGKRSEDGRKDWKRYYDASVVAGETEFQQLAKDSRCLLVLISSNSDDTFWKDMPGHYVTLWLYDEKKDEVFLADSSGPSRNREWIPLQTAYDALKRNSPQQYLSVTGYDKNEDAWTLEMR